jgi:hypothetical protein
MGLSVRLCAVCAVKQDVSSVCLDVLLSTAVSVRCSVACLGLY